jgi:hypothetical protein
LALRLQAFFIPLLSMLSAQIAFSRLSRGKTGFPFSGSCSRTTAESAPYLQATNRQRFWPRMRLKRVLAMLIRGERCGVWEGAGDAVSRPSIPAATLPTQLLGGLLLLIGP